MTTNDDERVQLTPDDWQKSAIHRAFGRWTAANGTPEAETAGSRSPSRAVQRKREGGKVQARLVGTDAHVLGTERLLQRILGHLGQHLGHHLNFAQLLAVDESTSSSRLSSVSGCAVCAGRAVLVSAREWCAWRLVVGVSVCVRSLVVLSKVRVFTLD